jgi:hypothetical protein
MTSFTSLCANAALALGADDPDAAAEGDQFIAQGIWCQLSQCEDRPCALLICDLGDPQPATELDLYRQLLLIQSHFAGNTEAMFIRDPINEALLFTITLPLRNGLDGQRLAELITPVLEQVQAWRHTLLKEHFVDHRSVPTSPTPAGCSRTRPSSARR